MGSKKRNYFALSQKRIKQKWKDQYEISKLKPKPIKQHVELFKEQKKFNKFYLNFKKFYPSRSIYTYYKKIIFSQLNYLDVMLDILIGYQLVDMLTNDYNIEKIKLIPKFLNKKSIKVRNVRIQQIYSLLYLKYIGLYFVNFENQTLFLLCNSTQQYHLNTLGINYKYYKTMSSGRCLRQNFGYKVSKALKKSIQLNKALVDYYFEESTFELFNHEYTHTILRPFNKKALLLFDQIQNNALYYPTIIGFIKYYKTVYKTARRIKKTIKKIITSENMINRAYIKK